MKQKLLTLFIAILASTATLWAEGTKVDGIWYDFDSVRRTATVTYRGSFIGTFTTEYTDDISIPSSVTYNGISYRVTSIGNDAFYKCSGLTSVNIPNSVTSIGSYAFCGCSGLTSVNIPNSVTSIGSYAFSGCSGITSPVYNAHIFAYMPTNYSGTYIIPDGIEVIAGGAFAGCTGLSNITIPNSVTTIGKEAFDFCDGLTSVHINDIASWCNIAFSDLSANPLLYAKHLYVNNEEIAELTIPDNVTSIGKYAFAVCSGLTSLIISDSVTCIGDSAFFKCSGLKSIEISNSVTTIGKYAFLYCGLKSVTLNSNAIVGKIYSADFNLSDIFGSNVKKYIIGDDVTSIGSNAFDGCSGLTSVTVGKNVANIGSRAFYNCTSLTNITWNAQNCPTISNNADDIPFYSVRTQIESFTFGDEVKAIPDFICYEMRTLSPVDIPNSVTSIGDYSFYGCSGLTSVTIGKNVASIGAGAFRNCSGLTSVTIPNSVTSIGDYAFCCCFGLTSIAIPSNVTTLGEGIFADCSSLTKIEIPNSISSIGAWAFCLCSGLTSIEIPNSVTNIEYGAFCGCSGLKSIEIPHSVTSLGECAFQDCSALATLSLGENITAYGDSTFAGCPALTTIYNYRNRPAKLGTGAFSDVDYFNCTLYVLAGSVEMYKSSGSEWKDFFYFIEPIGAETVVTDEMQVAPTETTVAVTWPKVENAATYELLIKDKNGNIVCTLIFNANGQLTQIAFGAPARDNATQAIGFSFTVTGLEGGTSYDLTITAKDSQGAALQTTTQSFTTMDSETAIGFVESSAVQDVKKLIRNGQLLILRDGKTYTVQGWEVR